jgi:hypothetical protein
VSETNGHSPEEARSARLREDLDRVTASRVMLMTDHEVFVKEQERAWEEHREFVRQQEARNEQDRLYRVEVDRRLDKLGERIDRLVIGIGEFIRRETGK